MGGCAYLSFIHQVKIPAAMSLQVSVGHLCIRYSSMYKVYRTSILSPYSCLFSVSTMLSTYFFGKTLSTKFYHRSSKALFFRNSLADLNSVLISYRYLDTNMKLVSRACYSLELFFKTLPKAFFSYHFTQYIDPLAEPGSIFFNTCKFLNFYSS
jgi:hypothetical protein